MLEYVFTEEIRRPRTPVEDDKCVFSMRHASFLFLPFELPASFRPSLSSR